VLTLMDGAHITNLRTGASAAVACKYLARREVRSVAVVGAGAQGRSCAACLGMLYPAAEFRIADLSAERRDTLRKELAESSGLKAVATDSAEAAVGGADVVVLVTTATRPFVREDWIAQGAVVLGMGSYQQVEDAFALSAEKIVVDSWAQAEHRGEIEPLARGGRIGREHIFAELGEIVAGRKPCRTGDRERTLVVLVGLGAHDICIAQHVHRQACTRGLGQEVQL